ncbi:hypothetical protein QTG56_22785 (plasmid) [Rossellomorea sp. AcN35-11]|nr:hypothetical protein QTG56_22785 [Rossellomorea sp. AcN35-11]
MEQIARHILDEFPNRKFENELARVAQSIDLIITLKSDRDRRKKRVIGVTEVIWDEDNKKHLTNEIIRYSPVTKQYYYSSGISKELMLLMAEENMEETRKLINLLKKREEESPMSEYENLKDKVFDEIVGELNNG